MTKKILLVAFAGLFVLPSFAPANGLNLNGLGSRAQGMGNAFVSIADDFSAVFWNPAGAAGFKQTTFGFFAGDLMPRTTYRFLIPEMSAEPFVDAKTKISHYLSFLAGYYKPIGDMIVLGLGIGTPSAQGVLWSGSDFSPLSNDVAYDWSSRIYMFTFTPMAAVKISDAISFGAALNINYGNWNRKLPGGSVILPTALGGAAVPLVMAPAPVDAGQYEELMNGWGIGVTLGLKIKPLDRLSVGLTVRTPSTVNFDGTASLSNLTLYGLPDSSGIERKLTWPLGIAGGVSFRPIDRLLLSADVQWTQWSKLVALRTTLANPVWAQLVDDLEPGRVTQSLNWRDTTQIRFGAEFALNPTTAFRAGYYRDPASGPDSAIDLSTRIDVLLPTFTGDAFTIGLGKTFGGLQLDFGLEYLAGHKRLDTPIFTSYISTIRAVVPSVSASYKF